MIPSENYALFSRTDLALVRAAYQQGVINVSQTGQLEALLGVEPRVAGSLAGMRWAFEDRVNEIKKLAPADQNLFLRLFYAPKHEFTDKQGSFPNFNKFHVYYGVSGNGNHGLTNLRRDIRSDIDLRTYRNLIIRPELKQNFSPFHLIQQQVEPFVKRVSQQQLVHLTQINDVRLRHKANGSADTLFAF